MWNAITNANFCRWCSLHPSLRGEDKKEEDCKLCIVVEASANTLEDDNRGTRSSSNLARDKWRIPRLRVVHEICIYAALRISRSVARLSRDSFNSSPSPVPFRFEGWTNNSHGHFSPGRRLPFSFSEASPRSITRSDIPRGCTRVKRRERTWRKSRGPTRTLLEFGTAMVGRGRKWTIETSGQLHLHGLTYRLH